MGFQIHDFRNLLKRKNSLNPLECIHSPSSFLLTLERERARAERAGHVFSLVLFGSNHEERTDIDLLERLGTILAQKVRMSDEVGWYEEGKSIGALLPGTTAEGAAQFIGFVREKIGEAESRLESTVYTYPNPIDSSGNRKEVQEVQESLSHQKCKSSVPANSSSRTQNSGTAACPIEGLFALRYPFWKRAIDFFGALLLLVLLSPLFLLVALFIKVVSLGPVIYRQERIGYKRKPFTFLKFRTMHVDNDSKEHCQYLGHLIEHDAPMKKLDDGSDNRIIPFGRLLRYSCIDELPQLINVLKGDMSLVGPRPCLPYEAEKYLRWHTRRFDTMPGMTGLWQVSGKNHLTFKEMIRLDIRYSRSMSAWKDAKILLLTGPAILGMVSEPHASKKAIKQKTATFTTPRREQSVRG